MNINDYENLAMSTEADQAKIHERIYRKGVQATRLQNGVRGLSDEVGELNAVVKKWLEYDRPLDRDNVLEEMGDCLWRLCQIGKACNITLAEAMEANLRKLRVRYDGGYNDQLAAEENRNRQAEREALGPPKKGGQHGSACVCNDCLIM